jgi:hypothetical protein
VYHGGGPSSDSATPRHKRRVIIGIRSVGWQLTNRQWLAYASPQRLPNCSARTRSIRREDVMANETFTASQATILTTDNDGDGVIDVVHCRIAALHDDPTSSRGTERDHFSAKLRKLLI